MFFDYGNAIGAHRVPLKSLKNQVGQRHRYEQFLLKPTALPIVCDLELGDLRTTDGSHPITSNKLKNDHVAHALTVGNFVPAYLAVLVGVDLSR